MYNLFLKFFWSLFSEIFQTFFNRINSERTFCSYFQKLFSFFTFSENANFRDFSEIFNNLFLSIWFQKLFRNFNFSENSFSEINNIISETYILDIGKKLAFRKVSEMCFKLQNFWKFLKKKNCNFQKQFQKKRLFSEKFQTKFRNFRFIVMHKTKKLTSQLS